MDLLPRSGDEPRADGLLAEIQSFRPTSDLRLGWNGLTKLVEEARATGQLGAVAPALFTLFERYPDVWPVFSLWVVVHALDEIAEITAPAVAESLRRRPSAFAAVVACRMVKLGHSGEAGISLPKLLSEAACDPRLSNKVRVRLQRELEFFEIA